jgi:hypothetical protein
VGGIKRRVRRGGGRPKEGGSKERRIEGKPCGREPSEGETEGRDRRKKHGGSAVCVCVVHKIVLFSPMHVVLFVLVVVGGASVACCGASGGLQGGLLHV